jgi:hypothetical protein
VVPALERLRAAGAQLTVFSQEDGLRVCYENRIEIVPTLQVRQGAVGRRTAGLFSAIIGGWIWGAGGSEPVTREMES